jgi:hypothetical protein
MYLTQSLLGSAYNIITDFRDKLADIPNVYTYQAFVESDKAGYVIRQWLTSNLYDRIRQVVLRGLTDSGLTFGQYPSISESHREEMVRIPIIMRNEGRPCTSSKSASYLAFMF